MPAYFIAQYLVKNPTLYREYQQGAGPTLGKRLAASDGHAVISQTLNVGAR